MTKRKLKDWVIPTLALFVVGGALFLYYMIGCMLNDDLVPNDIKFVNILKDPENILEVQQEIDTTIIKPFTDEKVTISKYYYSKEDEEQKQQQSLIKYENIYMPNTGILYSSDTEFEIVSTLDGTVTSIKEDEILGNIIEIEHNNVVTIYQSVQNIKVKIGDKVKQGDVIALSGPNKLENEKDNCLHFEVYIDGTIINPEVYYNSNIS